MKLLNKAATLITIILIGITTYSLPLKAEWSENNLIPGEKVIDLQTSDQVKISASFYYPTAYLEGDNDARKKTYPGVVLIHSWLRDRSDWSPLIPSLQKTGYAVIAIDLRNHGLSDGKKYWHKASYDHLIKMVLDAKAAYEYIVAQPFVDQSKISVMGVSIGTIVATKLCAEINNQPGGKQIVSGVVISPARNYFGVNINSAINHCTKTPFLFVVDKQDPSPTDNKIYTSGLALFRYYKGKKKLLEFNGIGHGNKMIKTETFISAALDWLKEASQ